MSELIVIALVAGLNKLPLMSKAQIISASNMAGKIGMRHFVFVAIAKERQFLF